MAGYSLSFRFSCLQGFELGGLCSDDGPKQSSSSLWTLVMRISCFLFCSTGPIKGVLKRSRLFLDCDSLYVFGQKRMYSSICQLVKILTGGFDAKGQTVNLKEEKGKDKRVGRGNRGSVTKPFEASSSQLKQHVQTLTNLQTTFMMFPGRSLNPF